jgi:hypothetical protein
MTKIKFIFFIFTLAVSSAVFANEAKDQIQTKQADSVYLKDIPNNQFTDYARIQILDKIMASSIEEDIKISEIYQFQNLSIVIHKCWKSKPEERPENKALITVKEYKKSTNEENVVFNGWMLSSSPSISSMEHVIYDITLIKCLSKDD